MWKKISTVRGKPMCCESADPVEQGGLAYLTPGDRQIKTILLSPVASKVWSAHSAVSVNRGSASANPLHVMIPQQRKKVTSIGKGCRFEPSRQEFKVLPLVLTNAIKRFAFGLSSELKLSVTKTSFTSYRSNAHCDTQQLTPLQKW